nr:molybdate ABC transporter permease protein [Klebsiella pneumoniae]
MGIERQYRRVVLVHSVHGLMYSVWICVAAFSAIDPLLARASRNLGAGPVYTFWHIVLPQAAPGIVAASIFVFWSRWMSLPALSSSGRRISPRCRCCSITPACRVTIRSRRLPR